MVNSSQSIEGLGTLRCTYRPSLVAIFAYATSAFIILIPLVLGVLVGIYNFRSHPTTLSDLFAPTMCLGVLGLFCLLFVVLLKSELRKWGPTRNHRLNIYANGFTYEHDGHLEVCAWNEIRDMNYRRVEVVSKSSRSKVNVIQSIVKRDGTVISFARTLNLKAVTPIFRAARSVRNK